MHSFETLRPLHLNIKKKVCVLGGYENYKDEFQKRISSDCLPIENKQNLGVNISKIDYIYKCDQKFEYLLWNIDCSQNRAFLRSTFYSGADALIIFVSEEKMTQVKQYFDEIHARIPEMILVFCVILENFSKKHVVNTYFNTEEFDSLKLGHSIKTYEISNQSEIFRQISSIILKRIETKEFKNEIIINFIHINSLFGHSIIKEECNDYYEPEIHVFQHKQKLINTKMLKHYIQNLDLDFEYEYIDRIKIINKNFGSFSLDLENGNVFYHPKICEKCKDKECSKIEKKSHFICIEEGNSSGWTNIEGINQSELLILAKLIALKEGNWKNLPKSVLKQIKNMNHCDKKRS
ncbi:MAG: hypothetical protein ACW98D_03300 [Promethearchaeota archaeon]